VKESFLSSQHIDTPIGPMIAIADDSALYLLEFLERRALPREMEQLQRKTKMPIVAGTTLILSSIEKELKEYFSGALQEFRTPHLYFGSVFQKQVWEALRKIPFGQTRSYADTAKAIGKPVAYRAVARANGTNQLAILIPCHRVINSDGALGGYGGGLNRKQWLLDHETTSGREFSDQE
jgi:AraC family transcriptional regulator of adaptative response/methylated-DNA-[protein]-cysteine methyltransferase